MGATGSILEAFGTCFGHLRDAEASSGALGGPGSIFDRFRFPFWGALDLFLGTLVYISNMSFVFFLGGPPRQRFCRKWVVKECRKQRLDCTGMSGSHIATFENKAPLGCIYIGFCFILGVILGSVGSKIQRKNPNNEIVILSNILKDNKGPKRI